MDAKAVHSAIGPNDQRSLLPSFQKEDFSFLKRAALLCLMAAGWALLTVAPLAAHTRSESHSSWLVDGAAVHLTYAMSDLEAGRLGNHAVPPDDREVIAYLTSRVGAAVGETPCPLAEPAHAVSAAPGYHRYEFLYDCPSSNTIVLHSDAFFDLVPTHVNLAQVQSSRGDFAEEVLTADARTIALSGQNGEGLENAGFFTFVRMGMMHIFTGVDHMSFLMGLVLISRRFRDLACVITGFTLGHSLTLALAFTGVIRPHAEFIDALVALTIALIGMENVSLATGRPVVLALATGGLLLVMAMLRWCGMGLLPPLLLLGAGLFAANYLVLSGHLRDAARLRVLVTLVFGLIHGFGFAADLLSEPMPPNRLAELLVGFNCGVEMGQLAVVSLLMAFVFLLSRLRLGLPRPIVVDVVAAFLVAMGMYWFIGRSFA
jgi:hypothetical protein